MDQASPISSVLISDFRDEDNFPPYEDLDSLRYMCAANDDDVPWFLLAEIIEVSLFLRVRLVVRDRDGKQLVVAFYPENNAEFDTSKLKVGRTLAVMLARQHFFLDGSQGVRVEDLSTCCVLPVGLDELLRTNEDLCDYAALPGNKCHACAKDVQKLVKCGACGFYYYCNKDCQIVGWKDKGHKTDCRILKDPNMKLLLQAQKKSGEIRFESLT